MKNLTSSILFPEITNDIIPSRYGNKDVSSGPRVWDLEMQNQGFRTSDLTLNFPFNLNTKVPQQ
jgi:hypothetical protein